MSTHKVITEVPGRGVHWPHDSRGRPAPVALPDGSSAPVVSRTIGVSASRSLTADDDGQVLDCTAADLTLTVPAGLPPSFGCLVIPNGTTSIESGGGALLNGATSALTRAAASNASVAIVGRAAANSYIVTGS